MNKNINRLFEIASREERMIIGLMSGTSMDGLDIALCRFSGHGPAGKVEVVKFMTAGYTDAFRDQVKS
ncbi:MAG: anhydro-N-acetylmuramic acid kinase, partial [Chitinophagaceae bacterium]